LPTLNYRCGGSARISLRFPFKFYFLKKIKSPTIIRDRNTIF
jgi:hypothetical protein